MMWNLNGMLATRLCAVFVFGTDKCFNDQFTCELADTISIDKSGVMFSSFLWGLITGLSALFFTWRFTRPYDVRKQKNDT